MFILETCIKVHFINSGTVYWGLRNEELLLSGCRVGIWEDERIHLAMVAAQQTTCTQSYSILYGKVLGVES